MPSTYTTNNGIELIGTGEQSGTWGDTTNTNLNLVDASLDGHTTITLVSAGTSGSPNSLPITDGASSNGRNRALIFTDGGDLGGDVYVQLNPSDAKKIIFVRNSLSGSRGLILFQGTYSSSNDFVLAAGKDAIVKFDGGGAGAVASAVLENLALDAATITTISNTTLNTATVNATTVDTTNIEVTNVKAKDGTASATIANSTGVMTIASSVLTTTDINGGTIDGATIGGSSAAAGTFTTATATTGNITTVNATTVDTTNIEVTTLKAKDGTAAGSIADTTGVVTLASSVLTTTDINGGTIDGTTIGGSSPAVGTFTTANATTVDTTNIEVTTLKAKDGTSAGSIADSTGVVTLASSVLTTTDINGGTIDGAIIGGSSAAAGTFTTATVSGNLTVDTTTLFVDATNNRVGVGTITPAEKLDIVSGLARFANDITPATESDGAAYFGKIGGQAFVSSISGFAVRDSGTTRLTVDTSGNVLQGTTSAITGAGGVVSGNQVAGTTSASGRAAFVYSATNTAAPVYEMGKSANATVGSHTLVDDGETLGTLRWSGSDGTNFIRAAEIVGIVNGTPGTSDMPGALTFGTTADGGTAPTERMRIDSSGNVGIGTTTPAATLDVSGTGAIKIPVGSVAQRPTPATGMFRFNNDTTKFEGYTGSAWGSVGGGATGGGSDEIFIENGQTVTTNYTITTNKNAMSTGPITINSGITVTVPSGSNWVIL